LQNRTNNKLNIIMTTLKKGDNAPAIKAKDQDGNDFSLTEYKGKKVILYFYPADNTPTCTTEACNLRDNYLELQKQGYDIVGVSPDDEKSHGKFISKFGLPFRLITDPENKVAMAYGVWGHKKLFGKDYMGVLRTTFIIDEKGKIEKVIDKVKSKEHSKQILG